jgi:hypothetical protein
MARYAYVTRRLAPLGYVAITKPLAKELYEQGHAITLCMNNVNAYHIFQGWHLGYVIDKESPLYSDYRFDDLVGSYRTYQPKSELGTYVVYYVKTCNLQAYWQARGRCRTCGEGGHLVAGQCILCATRPSTAGK